MALLSKPSPEVQAASAATSAMTSLCVWLITKDLRVHDNPIVHHFSKIPAHETPARFLPLYVWNAKQVDTSGFLKNGETSPYPRAVSLTGQFPRTGPYRANFTAESVGELRSNLEAIGSGLVQRVGTPSDVLSHLITDLAQSGELGIKNVFMTEGNTSEENQDQKEVQEICDAHNISFKLFKDEKYFVDDEDKGFVDIKDLPDNFSAWEKRIKPLREVPRACLPSPLGGSLPPLPDKALIPAQHHPFIMVDDPQELKARLERPLRDILDLVPQMPENAVSAHPFRGGEISAMSRLRHYIESGGAARYSNTRNGMLGEDFSTKLSGYLALGCLTARQIHHELVQYETGTDARYSQAEGFGKGENTGTSKIRNELVWRDYMRLASIKFGNKLFHLHGFREGTAPPRAWLTNNLSDASPHQKPSCREVDVMIKRFQFGTTGLGLIDASARELLHTGYTSNRARQNVASFLAKRLGIDWRIGAEWYECMLVDYDVHSNWGNWQYQAGVGNDPRSNREFNPVKQAFDYDKGGSYVKMWVPELRELSDLHNVFQVATTSPSLLSQLNLRDHMMAHQPMARITFDAKRRPPKYKNQRHKRKDNPSSEFVQTPSSTEESSTSQLVSHSMIVIPGTPKSPTPQADAPALPISPSTTASSTLKLDPSAKIFHPNSSGPCSPNQRVTQTIMADNQADSQANTCPHPGEQILNTASSEGLSPACPPSSSPPRQELNRSGQNAGVSNGRNENFTRGLPPYPQVAAEGHQQPYIDVSLFNQEYCEDVCCRHPQFCRNILCWMFPHYCSEALGLPPPVPGYF